MHQANHDDLHGSKPQPALTYFTTLQPTAAALQTGLAVLGFLLVLRLCYKRGYLWVKRPRPSSTLQFSNDKPSPIVSWERYSTTYAGDVAEMRSNTTRLPNEADASQTDGVSTAHTFTGPPGGREQLQGQFMTRLPPAPPLTPPELSSTIYSAGEDRQAGVHSFINQPNPDYLSVSEPLPMDSIATPAPRRRSHMTTMPMPIPTPQSSSLSARDGSSPEQACTSHSYPPSSPILPPAPPEDPEVTSEGDFPHRNVDVRGEIISVLDGDGAGWTRHTRVYGGGVCLACSAAGGGHEGGFYGATVTPEEMR